MFDSSLHKLESKKLFEDSSSKEEYKEFLAEEKKLLSLKENSLLGKKRFNCFENFHDEKKDKITLKNSFECKRINNLITNKDKNELNSNIKPKKNLFNVKESNHISDSTCNKNDELLFFKVYTENQNDNLSYEKEKAIDIDANKSEDKIKFNKNKEKKNNDNTYTNLQLSISLTHSSRYINKKEFFDEICFLCSLKKSDCIEFENKIDIIKSLSSLIIMRKSIKELKENELEILDNNFETIKKIFIGEIQIKFIDENYYKGKFYCIQCLINIISSEDIIKTFQNLFNNKELEKKIIIQKEKNAHNNNSSFFYNESIDNKTNFINYKEVDKQNKYQINENNFNTSSYKIDDFNKNHNNSNPFPIKTNINDSYNQRIFIDNFNQEFLITINNLDFELIKIHLNLFKIIQGLIILNDCNYCNNSLKDEEKKKILTNVGININYISQNNKYILINIINNLYNEFQSLFGLGLNVVIFTNKCIDKIENQLKKNRGNKNLLYMIQNLKRESQNNYQKLRNSHIIFMKVLNF